MLKTLIHKLNSEIPEIKEIQELFDGGDSERAARLLHAYYKRKDTVAFLSEPKTVFRYLREQVPEDTEAAADRLLEQCFIFNDPWDMEKCLTPVSFPQGQIDWQHVEDGDAEWMFMLNRHHYLQALAEQYMISGESRYYQKLEELLFAWMDQEPSPEGRESSSWRTIDTGIRLKHWVRLFEYLRHCPEFSEALCIRMLIFIEMQVEYLLGHFTPALALSNWRILEFHGVYIASVYFHEFAASDSWITRSGSILNICLPLQVTADGFHWEQSFMYHHEVMLCMLEALLVSQRSGYPLADDLRAVTLRMGKAASHLVTPDGCQTCYGDSDIEEVGELLTLCALVFPEESFGGQVRTEANTAMISKYGGDLIAQVKKLDNRELPVLDYAHEDVGNYFLRSGWGREDNFLFFKNGFLGSGHGHADLLHFDLFVHGQPVLADSGRYTYNPDKIERQRYKAASAHNTLTVDGEEFMIQKRAWATSKVADEIKRPVRINQPVTMVQGMHLGYFHKQVVVNRKIIWIKPGIWFLADESFAAESAEHSYEQYFHFCDCHVAAGEGQFRYQNQVVNVRFLPLTAGSTITKESCWISPAYNQQYPSERIVVRNTVCGCAALEMLIFDETKTTYECERLAVFDMNGNEVDSGYVSAVKIQDQDVTWLICVNHREEGYSRKLYMVDGTPVYGRAVVVKKREHEVPELFHLEY